MDLKISQTHVEGAIRDGIVVARRQILDRMAFASGLKKLQT
jgi:hypothetical protein